MGNRRKKMGLFGRKESWQKDFCVRRMHSKEEIIPNINTFKKLQLQQCHQFRSYSRKELTGFYVCMLVCKSPCNPQYRHTMGNFFRI